LKRKVSAGGRIWRRGRSRASLLRKRAMRRGSKENAESSFPRSPGRTSKERTEKRFSRKEKRGESEGFLGVSGRERGNKCRAVTQVRGKGRGGGKGKKCKRGFLKKKKEKLAADQLQKKKTQERESQLEKESNEG